MLYQTAKALNPTLQEIRFAEYLLLCEGNQIKFAFLLEYMNRNKYIGCDHLHSAWVAQIQEDFDKGHSKPAQQKTKLFQQISFA